MGRSGGRTRCSHAAGRGELVCLRHAAAGHVEALRKLAPRLLRRCRRDSGITTCRPCLLRSLEAGVHGDLPRGSDGGPLAVLGWRLGLGSATDVLDRLALAGLRLLLYVLDGANDGGEELLRTDGRIETARN